MRSAYYQLPLAEGDRHITAFEADGRLWEFTRLPFGVTNGVPTFCRVMNTILSGLPGVVAYFDDIVVHGRTQGEHDENLRQFMARAREVDLTLNSNKCIFSVNELSFLGHTFKDGLISPDAERLAPLMNYPVPQNVKEL